MQLNEEYDLVLHIGAPKTGSSALQYFMLQNREKLEECGFYYPEHGLDSNKISGGHSEITVALINKDPARAKAALNHYIERARIKGLTLLLSAEGLYTYAEAIKQLAAGLRVRVVSFFRDPLESILSNHNQWVKRHYGTLRIDQFCEGIIKKKEPEYFSGGMIMKWLGLFGERDVVILPYDLELFSEQRIEYLLLDTLGIPGDEWGGFRYETAPINRGYTESAKETKRLLNQVLERSPDKELLNAQIDVQLQKFSETHPERVKSLMSMLPAELTAKLLNLLTGSGDLERVRSHVKYPAKENWLKLSMLSADRQGKSGRAADAHMYSLRFVVEEAFANESELLAYVKHCILDRLTNIKDAGDRLRLFDAFDFKLPTPVKQEFNESCLEQALAESAGKVLLYQAIALLLEDSGNFESGLKVINRAIELQPQRKMLVMIRERLIKKRNTFMLERGVNPVSGFISSTGNLDGVDERGITGWVIGDNPLQAVELIVEVNGIERQRILANRFRKALFEKGLHPTGNCGFKLIFNGKWQLNNGDVIALRPAIGSFSIGNSPYTVG